MKKHQTQNKLWETSAEGWTFQEKGFVPLYRKILDTIKLNRNDELLDIGCGTGLFCEMASRINSKISGVDSSSEFLSFSQKRVPNGLFKKADMEDLPFAEKYFDYAVGINSFQYPKNPMKALHDAHRVLKDNGKLIIALWGKPENCDSASYLFVFHSFIYHEKNEPPLPFIFSGKDNIESLVSKAGFKADKRITVNCPRYYPNLNIALKGILSSGPGRKAILNSSYNKVSENVTKAIEPYKTPDGKYVMNNEFFFVMCNKNSEKR